MPQFKKQPRREESQSWIISIPLDGPISAVDDWNNRYTFDSVKGWILDESACSEDCSCYESTLPEPDPLDREILSTREFLQWNPVAQWVYKNLESYVDVPDFFSENTFTPSYFITTNTTTVTSFIGPDKDEGILTLLHLMFYDGWNVEYFVPCDNSILIGELHHDNHPGAAIAFYVSRDNIVLVAGNSGRVPHLSEVVDLLA